MKYTKLDIDKFSKELEGLSPEKQTLKAKKQAEKELQKAYDLEEEFGKLLEKKEFDKAYKIVETIKEVADNGFELYNAVHDLNVGEETEEHVHQSAAAANEVWENTRAEWLTQKIENLYQVALKARDKIGDTDEKIFKTSDEANKEAEEIYKFYLEIEEALKNALSEIKDEKEYDKFECLDNEDMYQESEEYLDKIKDLEYDAHTEYESVLERKKKLEKEEKKA